MNARSALQQKNMQDGQLRTNAITDPRIMEALSAVDRDVFVPERFKGVAFVDEDLPIAPQRYMMEPLVFSTLLTLANVQSGDRVLVIGAGMGYSAAVLAHMGAQVTALESDASLFAQAKARLKHIPQKVDIHQASLEAGWPNQSYDVIFMDGGVQFVPPALAQQLASKGRLVAVEVLHLRPGASSGLGTYLTLQNEGGHFAMRREANAFVHVLPGFVHTEGFSL
jgi:protein-L-isoaspartate(D-aspartate) O-methyltransferase